MITLENKVDKIRHLKVVVHCRFIMTENDFGITIFEMSDKIGQRLYCPLL